MAGRLRSCVAAVGMAAGVALAGRPMVIDDADPAKAGMLEFEAGAAYEQGAGCKHWDIPFGLSYGMGGGVEIGGGFGGQFEERTELLEDGASEECSRVYGVGDLTLGAKWQFLESCPVGARHAIVPCVKFPTADEGEALGNGETDYDLTWIASRSIGERVGAHHNLGYSWIGGQDADVLHYGVALDYQILESVQWVGEVFVEKELVSGSDAVVQYNAGFRWGAMDGLTLDIAGGSRLSGDAPDFTATAGVTWTFGTARN